MKIHSIQVGMPKNISYRGKEVFTGIFKESVVGPVQVTATGIQGDGQGDLSVHGGVDKAVYAYPFEVYEEWKKLRLENYQSGLLEWGAFGENLTVINLREDLLSVGDVFQVGSVTLEVSAPRFPCSRLGLRFNDVSIIKEFMQVNRPGVYFRVLQPGSFQAGDSFLELRKAKYRISIQELFEKEPLAKRPRTDLEEILKNKSLTQNWARKIRDLL